MTDKTEELIPFFALGVLTEVEAEQVRSYLIEHPEAEAELSEMTESVAALVYQPAPMMPPAHLKQALMTRARADSLRPPVLLPQPGSPAKGWWANFWQQLSGNPLAPTLAGLSVVIALLAGIWINSLQQEINQLRQSVTALDQKIGPLQADVESKLGPIQEENVGLKQEIATQQEQLTTLEREITSLQEANEILSVALVAQTEQSQQLSSQLAAVENEVAQIPDAGTLRAALEQELAAQAQQFTALNEEVAQLRSQNERLARELLSQRTVMAHATSPNVQAMAIDGTEALPGAHGQLIANPSNETAALIVSGLPPLQPGLVYKFWLVRGEELQEAGVVEVDAEGLGILVVNSDTAIGTYDRMGVSIEPTAGGPQPTNQMIMLGNFSS